MKPTLIKPTLCLFAVALFAALIGAFFAASYVVGLLLPHYIVAYIGGSSFNAGAVVVACVVSTVAVIRWVREVIVFGKNS
jgi:hypothetical protein